MKASELMIGDWVIATCKENIPPVDVLDMLPRAGRVVGIEADCIYLDFCDFGFMPQDLAPVTLTPEILEKNGFEHGGVLHNTYIDGDSNYTITIDKYGRGQCDIMNHLFHIGVTMECCGMVHELQHTLQLCGIDKEITI